MSASMYRFSVGDEVLVQGLPARVIEVDEQDAMYPYCVEFVNHDTGWFRAGDLIGHPRVTAAETVDVLGEVTRTVTEAQAPQDPKAKFGATKPSYGLISGAADALTALAMEDGARKYGAFNFRESQVEVMTYAHACLRHVKAWIDRQDFTSDTHVPNIGAARACLDIIMDAMAAGTAIDNRPRPGGAAAVQDAAQAWKKAVAAGEDPGEAAKRLLGPAMGLKP